MSHPYDEAEDRVIARALHTDGTDGTDGTDEIDEAAMDRATLDEYQRVLAHLPFEDLAPPAELEDRVVEAALARRPAAARSISGGARRRRNARWVALGAAVTAAAAVIGFMFATANDDQATPGGRVELTAAGTEDRRAVLDAPGVREASLIDTNDNVVGQVALAPDGSGLLYDLALPTPADGDVLHVWLVTDQMLRPIGPLRTPTDDVALHVSGNVDAVEGVMISTEESETPATSTEAEPAVVARARFE